VPVLSVSSAEAASPLFVSVTGPTTVAASETRLYNISAVGGPGEGPGGNYSMTAKLVGPHVNDTLVTPGNGVDRNGTFQVSVKMPSVAQTVQLEVVITSSDLVTTLNLTKDYSISVVSPIVISVKVVNSGLIAVQGVPIDFFVDSVKIFSTTVNIAANSSQTVVYNWTVSSLSVGTHEVTVQLDPTNEFVTFEGGGAVFTKTIYYGSPGYGSSDGLIIALIALMLFVLYIIYRRPKRKRKK
jgi:hypothetical protein